MTRVRVFVDLSMAGSHMVIPKLPLFVCHSYVSNYGSSSLRGSLAAHRYTSRGPNTRMGHRERDTAGMTSEYVSGEHWAETCEPKTDPVHLVTPPLTDLPPPTVHRLTNDQLDE